MEEEEKPVEKEQGQEVKRLLNVLRRMARTARMNQWTGMSEHADSYTIDQYNRILDRLKAVDNDSQDLFAPMPSDASWSMISNACRDLAAYYEYEDEPVNGGGPGWDGIWTDARAGIWIDKSAFLHGMPAEIAELRNFVREKISEWQDRKRQQPR